MNKKPLIFLEGEDPSSARKRLISIVKNVPLSYRKWIASYYPDAFVRREYLKSIGVIFSDDSSFVNIGFIPIPNSPSSTHVRIGKNISIAPNVVCVTGSDANNGVEINTHPYVAQHLTKEEGITIEDEVWIGANVTILPGVTIGKCAVIGAGCVMAKNADPFGIYAGVPGKKIGDVRKWDGYENE